MHFSELDNFSTLFTLRKQNVARDLYILAVVYKLLDDHCSKFLLEISMSKLNICSI